ncbi:MAG: type III-B CRISPR module-associated protein Cmr3 [Candidatus Aminicenantes bacterium]|nr:type III-B CRISPR module-associated protein Cmr3 [Candidatus Aminicenantes bacterium]
MRFNIKPLESFLFRDAKPFETGDTIAEGIFPFLPSTLYGAVRGTVLAQRSKYDDFLAGKDPEIKKQVGTPKSQGDFSLKSQFLTDGEKNYFITPRDLVCDRKGDSDRLLPQVKAAGDYTSEKNVRGLEFYRTPDRSMAYPEESWLHDLKSYLMGDFSSLQVKKKSDFFAMEEKTGIAVDKTTGTAEEHMLFTQRRHRLLEEYRILSDFERLSLLDPKGILTMGQDRRLFEYELVKADPILSPAEKEEIISRIDRSKKFKIFFASPAVFANGWLPEGVSKEDFSWEISKQLKIEIYAVFSGAPVSFGGWNHVYHIPRTMRRAISAGTVFYCRLAAGDAAALFDHFFDRTISDYKEEHYDRQGFGHTFIANIDE